MGHWKNECPLKQKQEPKAVMEMSDWGYQDWKSPPKPRITKGGGQGADKHPHWHWGASPSKEKGET